MIPPAEGAGLPQWVSVAEGRITHGGTGPVPAGAIDPGAARLVPGFVDLQVNGVGGDDCATADGAAWRRIGARLAAAGVTAWCPTFTTAALAAYDGYLDAVARAARDAEANHLPRILGAHLEGPFLGGAPGAHRRDLIVPADVEWLAARLDAHPGVVRVVTLAPEADPGFAATRMLTTRGVTVAIGHSAVDHSVARAAADAGATVVTHLYNAMSGLHHRAPGVAAAALDDDRLTPTLIADFVHVDAVAVRLALAAKARVALVSDSVALVPPLVARDGAAFRPDGALAGATLLLDGALRNLLAAGVPFTRALACVTSVPAGLVGEHDAGTLRAGGRADLVALDPATASVARVWIGGREVREVREAR